MLLVAILLLLNFQHCESVFVNSQVMLLFPSMKMLLLKERRTLLGTNKNSTRGLTQEQIQGFLAFIHTYQLVSSSHEGLYTRTTSVSSSVPVSQSISHISSSLFSFCNFATDLAIHLILE